MRRITFFLSCFYCLTACNNIVCEDCGEAVSNQKPRIELSFPTEEVVNVYSTATEYENTISNLWVLVFQADGETLDAWEFIDVSKIVRKGDAIQLLPELSFTPIDGRKIVCIANSDIDAANALPSGITYSNINQKFTLKKNNYFHGGDTDHLPMYGEFIWSVSSGYTCTMTRAVAKIQVQMGTGVSDVTGNFSAESVSYTIYYAGYQGLIQPTPGVVSGIPRPSGTTFTRTHYLIQKQGATRRDTHVYLYEYPSSNRTGLDVVTDIGNKTFHAERSHIILKKDNTPNPATYYRLDFYNPKDSTYFDTKRNHHYMFTINKVRSEGYTSAEEAQNNPGSNIEYIVRVEDDSRQIKSNGQYAIAANIDTGWIAIDRTRVSQGSDFGLFYTPYLNDIGTVRYILPNEMSYAPPWTTATNSITLKLNEFLSNGYPNELTLFSPLPRVLTLSPQTLTVGIPPWTALAKGTITFQLGNITYQFPVKFCSAAGVFSDNFCDNPDSYTLTQAP